MVTIHNIGQRSYVADSTLPKPLLKGWKSIAIYFGRDQSTVIRWAAQRGLPVRRLPGTGRSSVYAIPDELAAWLASEGSTDAAAIPTMPPPADPPAVATPAFLDEPSLATTGRPAIDAIPLARSKRCHVCYLAAAFGASVAIIAAAIVFRAPVHHVVRPAFTDPALERDYLTATYDLDLRTPSSLKRAVDEFGSIIGRDPTAAPAYAALGETYLLLREYTTFPAATAYPDAKAAAKAALAIDPNLLAAHRVLAFVAFWNDLDIPTARIEFARARTIDPKNAQTWHWYATALSANGEQAAALDAIGEARRLEPQSTPIAADYGLIAYLAGHHAEGLAALHAIAAGAPTHMSIHRYLADLALARGDGATYLDEASVACRLKDDGVEGEALAAERVAFATGGEAGLLAAMSARLAKTPVGTQFDRARIAALQGRDDTAVAELHAAAAAHEIGISSLPGDLALQSLVGNSDFDAMRGRAPLTSGEPTTPL